MEGNNRVQFVIGNTYQRLSEADAPFDRSGCIEKVHDWTLYVDIVRGNVDCIERVAFHLGGSFEPDTFYATTPVEVTRPNGTQAWRFATRQQTYGAVDAGIKIRGTGGSILNLTHLIELDEERARKKPIVYSFQEHRVIRPFRMLKLPEHQRFGVELELTSAPNQGLNMIANQLGSTLIGHVQVIDTYSDSRAVSTNWKLVPDSSILCSRNNPDCNTFEIVSPVLSGGQGLGQISCILTAIGTIEPKLKVNKSMGFHVHIDVENLSLGQLIKVCQQFIKFEDVLDSFMPESRRNGSPECDRFFQSNRSSVDGSTAKQRHCALTACSDIDDLVAAMNSNGRYYKLNLTNLATGRQPTIEFRQHSATANYEKMSAWIRLCVAFVGNSARLAAPKAFMASRTLDEQTSALFQYVVKDRALRDFYLGRQEKLEQEDEACCSGCQHGQSCGKVGMEDTNGGY